MSRAPAASRAGISRRPQCLDAIVCRVCQCLEPLPPRQSSESCEANGCGAVCTNLSFAAAFLAVTAIASPLAGCFPLSPPSPSVDRWHHHECDG